MGMIFTDNSIELAAKIGAARALAAEIFSAIRNYKMMRFQNFLTGDANRQPIFDPFGIANARWPMSTMSDIIGDANMVAGPESNEIYRDCAGDEGPVITEPAFVQSLRYQPAHARMVSQSAAERFPDYVVRGGDILVSSILPGAGATAILPLFGPPAMLGAGCIRIRAAGIETFYLLNVLHYYYNAAFFPQEPISSNALLTLRIPLPPTVEQTAISDTLFRLSAFMEAQEKYELALASGAAVLAEIEKI